MFCCLFGDVSLGYGISSKISDILLASYVAPFISDGLNKFIYPGLTASLRYFPVEPFWLTTFTDVSTYLDLATALFSSESTLRFGALASYPDMILALVGES